MEITPTTTTIKMPQKKQASNELRAVVDRAIKDPQVVLVGGFVGVTLTFIVQDLVKFLRGDR